jgi:lipid-A-disaccharide synthase
MRTLYFVAGEVSGDNHGAALMSSLRKRDGDLNFIGRGGPQMRAIGGKLLNNWLDEAAVLGLWEVIKKYGYFRKQFDETIGEIDKAKPDAVVLIDYPGFNLRLARALRRQTPSQKMIYYISPQVWAWNRGRIARMALYLDLMLCIFPFEAELYNKSGLRTEFVGHPMIDRLRPLKIDIERESNVIGLFPGSRRREVRKIFPVMIGTVSELLKTRKHLRFEVAAASQTLAEEMYAMLDPSNVLLQGRQSFQITTGETAAIMQRAFVGVVASGSATLEAAYFRLPFVLVYKVAWPTYLAARLVVKVKHLGMPNVLAGKEIVPEFIQHRAQPAAIAEAVLNLMDAANARERMISEFDSIIAKLGQGGASDRAAMGIIKELQSVTRSR